MSQSFHLPILILQQFAIGQHFPLDVNSISCAHPGLNLQGNRKCTTDRLLNSYTQLQAGIEKNTFLLSSCFTRVVLCYL